MRLTMSALVAAVTFAATASAQTPALPADAVQLKGGDIAAYLDGKRFAVAIYDADAPIKATVNWDLKNAIVFGDFEMNGTRGKFENPWIIKGNTSCGEKTAKGAWVCQEVYVSGSVMYEVNKKGQIHAVSKLK